MTLEELKTAIEDEKLDSKVKIFKVSKDTFVARQYINAISRILKKTPVYENDFSSLSARSLFRMDSNNLHVIEMDDVQVYPEQLLTSEYYIVLCKKVTTELRDYIIEFPELENWMIEDYALSLLKGMKETSVKELVETCKYDIHRLDLEMQKLLIFPENTRQIIYNQLVDDNAFADLTDKNIFTFSTAVQNKDFNTLRSVYEVIEAADVEPLGLVTLLVKNFKKMIQVWMQSNPTPENTGLKSNQIWAIKNLPRKYSAAQLIEGFEICNDIEYELKSGYLPQDWIIDYLILALMK